MKYLDLFAGYGGFSLGIQQAYEDLQDLFDTAKHEYETKDSNSIQGRLESDPKARLGNPVCIGFSEIDKYAIQIYQKHFPEHKPYGDITKLDPTTLPDFDLLTGGFPCQAFSIAGKRGGFDDTRGTLIYDVFRILKEKQPRLCLLENVKGLLSHDNGRTFKTIITSLAELGYAVEWQVLNAKNFGVPQNRERVFIIGHLGGFGGRQVFPIGEIDKRISEQNGGIPTEILSPEKTGNITYDNSPILEAIKHRPLYQGAIMSEKNKKWLDDGKQLSRNFPQGQRVYSKDGISTTLASQAGGLGAKTGLYEIEKTKIRRLTPTECERLMGLPDSWTEGVSDTQRYKLCGNGVVVNVVREIIKKLF